MGNIAEWGPNLNVAPRISVVIPAREEERHLLASLDAVHESLRRVGGGEILVVDGMSRDRTRAIAEQFAQRQVGVRVLENPSQTTPAAFNIGIRAAKGSLIAIVSAHSLVGPEFFEAGVSRIDSGDADIVGGPISAEPGAPGVLPQLLSLIVRHPFGVGNSKFRISRSAGYVDAVPFAIYDAEVFRRLGLFHEALVRNQDTEFFGRVRAARLRVFLEPRMASVYLARATIPGLVRQGFLNAYWNVLVWRLTPAAFRWRHLIPGLFAMGVVALAVAGVWSPAAHAVLLGGLAAYGVMATLATLHIVARTRQIACLMLPPLFLLYHFCYGIGTLAGLRHLVAKERGPGTAPMSSNESPEGAGRFE